jgi:hypothetical protein
MPAITFITPQNISGTYDATWRSYDCTSILPGGFTASGVLIRYRFSTDATDSSTVGFRRGDSTDTTTWRAHCATGGAQWSYAACGIDSADDTFDYNVGTTNGTPVVQVVGFFDSAHVKFRQNAATFTPGEAVYSDINIATATGADTAVAAIFQVWSDRGMFNKIAWRKNGSSEDIYGFPGEQTQNSGTNSGTGLAICGVDGSEIFEAKQESANGGDCIALVGYFVSGITWNDPATDASTATTGSYQDVSVSGHAVYCEMLHTAGTEDTDYYVTKNEIGDDYYDAGPAYQQMLLEVDTGNKIRQKISATTLDLYMRATITAGTAQAPRSMHINRMMRG